MQKAKSRSRTTRDNIGNRTNTQQIQKVQGNVFNSGVIGSETQIWIIRVHCRQMPGP